MIKRVLPIIHSLRTRCYDFQFSCTHHSVHLAADLQVVMVFQKREEKNPNRKPKCPLSAYQKSKIIVNEVVRISHAKVVSRAASVCSSQMFSRQWEKFGFRRASAGCLGCWALPCKQLQHQNGTFWTGFCSCFYTVRGISHPCCWNQGWQQALYKQFTVTGVYGY